MVYEIDIDGKNYRLELSQTNGRWQCRLNDVETAIDAVWVRPDVISLLIGGKAYEIKRERVAGEMFLSVANGRFKAEIRDPRSLVSRKRAAGDEIGPRKIVATMPGKVVRVLVAENMQVDAGQGLLVVEAMKMQNEIKSPKKGMVQRLLAVEGAAVNAGDVLAVVE